MTPTLGIALVVIWAAQTNSPAYRVQEVTVVTAPGRLPRELVCHATVSYLPPLP